MLWPETAVGPDVLVQLVTPLTPVIAQVTFALAALGATALAGPETKAVKVMVPPSATVVGVAASRSTATVGSARLTVVA